MSTDVEKGVALSPPHHDGSSSDGVGSTEDAAIDSGSLRARRKYYNVLIQTVFMANHERRIDCSVLPLLFLGLLVFQLDRMNLASALTDGFAKKIRVNQNTINLGNQLMFLGIVVLEIPSNMILQRVSLLLS